MAYRALRNSPKFKQVQAQSVEDALAEPPASKGLFAVCLRVKEQGLLVKHIGMVG